MKIALTINPYSGGKKGIKLLPMIEKKLSDALNTIPTYLSLYHEHTLKIASELRIDEYDAVISVARDLDIYFVDDGIRSIVENKTKWIDVCSFSQAGNIFYFVNLAGLGFVTDVAKTAQKFKWLGDFSYIIGIFHRTADLHDQTPEAKIDDGLMDIIIVEKLSRTSLLSTLPKIYSGNHIRHPAVRYIKAKKAKIKTRPDKALLPDGEVFGVTPTTITVHHKMIRYLI